MRQLTTPAKLEQFIVEVGRAARSPVEVFFTGGVTAILYGWREATIDIDLKLAGDADDVLRALPALKERLGVNVELAAPDEFIPEVRGWRDRCIFIRTEGHASFFHYDPYAQALAKIERGHTLDVEDVQSMLGSGLVRNEILAELYDDIEPELYRYPAIDPADFRSRLESTLERRRT